MSIFRVPEFSAGQTIRFRKLDAIIRRFAETLKGGLTNGNIAAAVKFSPFAAPQQSPDPNTVYESIDDSWHQTYFALAAGPLNGEVGAAAPISPHGKSLSEDGIQFFSSCRMTQIDILVWGKDYTENGNTHAWNKECVLQLFDDQLASVFDVTVDEWTELDAGLVMAPSGSDWKLYKGIYRPTGGQAGGADIAAGYILGSALVTAAGGAVDAGGWMHTCCVTTESRVAVNAT